MLSFSSPHLGWEAYHTDDKHEEIEHSVSCREGSGTLSVVVATRHRKLICREVLMLSVAKARVEHDSCSLEC